MLLLDMRSDKKRKTDRIDCGAPSVTDSSVVEGKTAGEGLRKGWLDAGVDVGQFDVGGFEKEIRGVTMAVGNEGTGDGAVEAGRNLVSSLPNGI